tara:strand:- start:196 stop:510 length:315 start_codon:yes stop_codon:yes gene_type:complete
MLLVLDLPTLIGNAHNHFNKESLDSKSGGSKSEAMDGYSKIFLIVTFIISLIIILAFYWWAISLLFKFSLPPTISILCVIFLLFGNPLLSIIFAYLFHNQTTKM